MPRLSEFYGIVICMYFSDHNPPHFHAHYAGDEAEIAIESLQVLAGHLPPRAMGLVIEWAILRRSQLRRSWEQANRSSPIDPIDPLP
jgi:hypothetical protein